MAIAYAVDSGMGSKSTMKKRRVFLYCYFKPRQSSITVALYIEF